MIFTIFSASWKQKYSTFLDQLGPQNALQTLQLIDRQTENLYICNTE